MIHEIEVFVCRECGRVHKIRTSQLPKILHCSDKKCKGELDWKPYYEFTQGLKGVL